MSLLCLCVSSEDSGKTACAGSERGDKIPDPIPPPLENHKNTGFLSNTGPDPLKNHKATNPAFNVGPSSARQRNAT